MCKMCIFSELNLKLFIVLVKAMKYMEIGSTF